MSDLRPTDIALVRRALHEALSGPDRRAAREAYERVVADHARLRRSLDDTRETKLEEDR